MRDPHAITEERIEAAIDDAVELLRPLAKPARSWSIVSWNEPDGSDPRDAFEAAVEFVIALLDPPLPTRSEQAKTYDWRERQAVEKFLGVRAPIVQKVILPALRLGCPPEQRGPRRGGKLLRDRWIAAVIPIVCQRHDLDPYRNRLSEHRSNGIWVITEALHRLGIDLAETSVAAIYEKHRQA